MDPKPHPLMNEREAAAWLGLSVRWLQESRVRGDGPAHVKFARSVRYRMEDLKMFVDGRVRHSTVGIGG